MTTSKILSSHVAVIPARAGSKRLKHKNLKILQGKSLIERAVESALASKVFSEVIVSTDSQEIADEALRVGAKVPFLRPSQLAQDESSSADVGVDILRSLGADVHTTMTWLQPTSPLRTAQDIVASHKLYQQKKAQCVVSVCPCEHSPLWTMALPNDGNMQNFISAESFNKRSQDLAPRFRVNGAIYIVDTASFLQQKSFYIQGSKSFAFQMPANRSVDIDTQWDLDLAEFILTKEL